MSQSNILCTVQLMAGKCAAERNNPSDSYVPAAAESGLLRANRKGRAAESGGEGRGSHIQRYTEVGWKCYSDARLPGKLCQSVNYVGKIEFVSGW